MIKQILTNICFITAHTFEIVAIFSLKETNPTDTLLIAIFWMLTYIALKEKQ